MLVYNTRRGVCASASSILCDARSCCRSFYARGLVDRQLSKGLVREPPMMYFVREARGRGWACERLCSVLVPGVVCQACGDMQLEVACLVSSRHKCAVLSGPKPGPKALRCISAAMYRYTVSARKSFISGVRKVAMVGCRCCGVAPWRHGPFSPGRRFFVVSLRIGVCELLSLSLCYRRACPSVRASSGVIVYGTLWSAVPYGPINTSRCQPYVLARQQRPPCCVSWSVWRCKG